MRKSNKFHFLLYLAGLSIIGFLATDMYLPAFEIMRRDLGTSKQNIGASLTIFLGGYALAQLLWGPVSDRFGKSKAILLGLGIFTITSACLFFTKNIYAFLFLRLLQAVGACSAAVNWQALVIDRYPESETNKVFASIMPLVALSPALAPLLGVYILQHFGWEYIFITQAAIALLLIVYTLGMRNVRPATSPTGSGGNSYRMFFHSKNFIGNVLIYAFCSAGFFAWLTGAPFFLKELGYNESEIGLSFVPQTITFMIGGYGYRIISTKIDGKKILPYLLITYSACMIILLLLAVFTTPTMTTLLIPFCIMALSNGASYPIAVAEALKPFTDDSGKASALQNTLQLGACFLASAGVSLFSQHALMATCITMALTIIFVATGFRMTKATHQCAVESDKPAKII
jgi:Bcr/CflA subfamily drug resistance transporter